MYQTIILEKANGVAKLTLNRPDRLNSFNVEMHQELQAALEEIASDGISRCVLLTGAGRGFCAGQDLSDRAVATDGSRPDLGESVEKFYNPLIRKITSLKMPVVCSLNGVAAGAGASLVLACDIVLAARSSSFILSFAKVGLIPDSGSSWALARAIGMPRAKAMAMLANKIKADQAEQWGLIYQVVEDDNLINEATDMAVYLATQPTEALANIKHLINNCFENSLDEQLEKEKNTMQHLGHSDNYREGVSAFMEKRKANFKG